MSCSGSGRLYIAEKPSLARAIADVLPALRRRDGYFEAERGDLVAWCAGHILELATPDAYDPEYKHWRLEHLPISPGAWKLAVTSPELLGTIRALLPRVSSVVHAGDPDREGQLLVDEVLVFLGYNGPVERVLINDLNPDAVRRAIGAIQPNTKFRPLYEAALGRQRADWLYGLNLTRLYTILGRQAGHGGILSVGRVQTPLLGLIVRRDLEIERFVSKPYYKVLVELAGAAHPFTANWQPGPAHEPALDSEGRLIEPRIAAELVRRITDRPAVVDEASRDRKTEQPPLPYSLADLQVDAGRRLSVAPKDVLAAVQALYETHRLTTYPRSDCSYLPVGHLAQAQEVVRAIATVAPDLRVAAAGANLTLRSRAWNDSKVTAHHAIIPTPRAGAGAALSPLERDLYNLIARRYLAQFYPPHVYYQLEAHISVAGEQFVARGRQPVAFGWRALLEPPPEQEREEKPDEDDVDATLPPLQPGQQLRAMRAWTVEKKTKPPRRFTAASLVQAMTGIARYVSNPQIKQLLRETDGIGTPATQASIIQTLFERGFIVEEKRQIVSTPTGRALIRALPDVATQPDLTALWEAGLRRIQDGKAPLGQFLEAVEAQLGELVARGKGAGLLQIPGVETRPCPGQGCGGSLRKRDGKRGAFWACSRYPECRVTEDAAARARAGSGGRPPGRRSSRHRVA
jgi:DNA topoisomerase-3